MKRNDEKQEVKGEMLGIEENYEFFVVNLRNTPLQGTVSWNDKIFLDVNGVPPGGTSKKEVFAPKSGVNDKWKWSEQGRSYQLNVYGKDKYTCIVLSHYGIGILVTDTSPDTWKW